MSLVEAEFLLDISLLIALALADHPHHNQVIRWFDRDGYLNWRTCALTQGVYPDHCEPESAWQQLKKRRKLLDMLTAHPGHNMWPMVESWSAATSPFADRIFGHQQVTEAYLLGLAVERNGILITFDRAMGYLVEPQYRRNLLVLQP